MCISIDLNKERLMKFILPGIFVFLFSGMIFAADHEGFQYIRGKLSGEASIYNHGVIFRLVGDVAEAIYYPLEGKLEKNKTCSLGTTKRRAGILCTKFSETGGGNEKSGFECLIGINLETGQLEDSNMLCAAKNSGKWIGIEGRGSVAQHVSQYVDEQGVTKNVAGWLMELQPMGEVAKLMYEWSAGAMEKNTGCSSGTTKRFPGLICTKSVWRHKGKRNAAFECFVEINLKNGKIEDGIVGMCPEEHYDSYMDAQGNKIPTVSAQKNWRPSQNTLPHEY
jgi:hypothetical protein